MSQFYIIPPGGGPAVPTTFQEQQGAAVPAANIINIFGTGVLADGKSTAGNIFTSGAGNTVTIQENQAQYLTNYTNANAGLVANVYTAIQTDFYISCDTSAAGSNAPMTIKLPNAPTIYKMVVVKDRGGFAGTNNITITTVGGVVLIDGFTTFLLNTNYEAATIIFNGASYEVF